MPIFGDTLLTIPYTYVLEWTSQNKRYIGCRYAKGCRPDDLWVKYFTSSKYVDDFVKEHGKPDIVLIDQVCATAQEAMEREQFLQYKFDVRHNDQFLNKAVGGVWDHKDPETLKRRSESMKGYRHTPEWIVWITEFHRTRKRSAETGRRISAAKKGKKLSEEHRAKCKRGRLGKKHSPETKALMSLQRIGNKKMLGKKHTEATIQRMRKASKHLKNKLVSCHHCGKVGSEGGMIRCHFDSCKNK